MVVLWSHRIESIIHNLLLPPSLGGQRENFKSLPLFSHSLVSFDTSRAYLYKEIYQGHPRRAVHECYMIEKLIFIRKEKQGISPTLDGFQLQTFLFNGVLSNPSIARSLDLRSGRHNATAATFWAAFHTMATTTTTTKQTTTTEAAAVVVASLHPGGHMDSHRGSVPGCATGRRGICSAVWPGA